MNWNKQAIALAIGYLIAAGLTVSLTRFGGGVAFVWIASAILTSYLALTPKRAWAPAMIGCAVMSAVATTCCGLGPVAAPFLAVVNVAESAIAAWLLLRFIERPGDFASIGEVVRFTLIVGLAAPAVTAPAGALVATLVSGTPFVSNALNWTTGHALGAITVLPLALLVGRGEIRGWLKGADKAALVEAGALWIGMALVTFAVFVQTALPLLFLPLLPALFATFRLGRLGAAVSVVTLIAIGGPLTVYGSGPMALLDGALGLKAQLFQFYVAVTFLTVLPAAAELQHRKRLFSALHASEARFRLLAENTTDLIVLSALDTTRKYVSPASRRLLGYEPEELVGTKPLDFVDAEDREKYAAILDDLTHERVAQTVTRQRYRRKDGSWVWMEVSFSLTRDEATGAANGYVASLRDVTERWQAEDALRLSQERLSLALDGGSDGFWDWDLETGEAQISDQWFSTLGYDPGEMSHTIETAMSMLHPDDMERARRLLADHVKGLTPLFECEYRVKTKRGDYGWALARGKVVSRSREGRALRIVGTHIDITQRKKAELQVEHMAMHDGLTGLANRTLFRQRLQSIAMRAARNGRQFAILACDLDRFKAINDTRGHGAGDTVLLAVAARLKSVLRDGDFVARLGGDEFAIILDPIDGRGEAGRIAERVIELVGRPIDLDGQSASVGMSVGVALGQGDPADQIFKNADVALYEAKAEGRNAYRFFEHGMDRVFIARSQLETDLREAVARKSFALAYQPIINVGTGRICGFEALLRWPHPLKGMVSPDEFIPIAEETGMIVPIGDWALRTACMEAASWPDDLRIAVNVSAVQFQRSSLERSVMEALSASGLAPDRLELEITESVLMQNAIGVVSSLMRLRSLGVRIALDDFGTGYSSLSYLRRFPFNKIKIDRSFVAEIADPEVAAIVRAIVGLGERSGASITAEGVETAAQLDGVRREGCTEIQGYFFSRPLTAADAARFVEDRVTAPGRAVAG